MTDVIILFPDQLFESHPLLSTTYPIFLSEEYTYLRQFRIHKQKIAFHRSAMQTYEKYLRSLKKDVHYINDADPRSRIEILISGLAANGTDRIHIIDPINSDFSRRIRRSTENNKCKIVFYENPAFLLTNHELQQFFKRDANHYFQTKFYIGQRKRLEILVNEDFKPEGGKWTFDTENRKKYPKNKTVPEITYPEKTAVTETAREYTEQHFGNHPGSLGNYPLYPSDFQSARAWLQNFLETRFRDFGPYEDAIVSGQSILHHSLISPLLNTGLLTPEYVIRCALDHAESHSIPPASLEGFIRQIIGWREFMRGCYLTAGERQRQTNFWAFTRKMPDSLYRGATGIPPVDLTLKKVLRTGYCHHIERLMVLGNFMLLCEISPHEVYRWFMEMFIDAYDWVMVPNVYGMSQFADGGLITGKPYISGSHYLRKMSDYPRGNWEKIWDGLFWRFMDKHRDYFMKNPRMRMLQSTFDRFSSEKQRSLLTAGNDFIKNLI